LVTITSSPGLAPEEVTYSFFFAIPRAVTEITGLITASVISLCPPNISIPIWREASCMPSIRSFSISSSAPAGRSNVTSIPRGFAPQAAISLQEMKTERYPLFLLAPVMGSVEATATFSPKSIMLQSSPKPE